jgi:hypothetical protein
VPTGDHDVIVPFEDFVDRADKDESRSARSPPPVEVPEIGQDM